MVVPYLLVHVLHSATIKYQMLRSPIVYTRDSIVPYSDNILTDNFAVPKGVNK